MSEVFQKLIEKRGISSGFLDPKYEDLSGPNELTDMKKAVKRILTAKEREEKVLIYGDYDVDGVTATAIVYETLKLMGVTEIETMLPDRFLDGYGMSKRLVKRAKEMGAGLVITVDCGSNNAEIIEELKAVGIETVVTDHHEILGEIPKTAVAVVNPKRPDFRKKVLKRQAEILEGKKKKDIAGLLELSGAGVAFMLARALMRAGAIPEGQEKWLLDLTMIGTICDAMRLDKDNRIICKYGMIVLAKTRRVGLKALMRVAGATKINTETIGFQIGPRLNAAGRMETAEISLELLTTRSKVTAEAKAEELNQLNMKRRVQQTLAVEEVEKQGISSEPVIVVSGNWHEGVLGIIAGRLTEKYKKPSFVLTEVDGELKGSGRSFGEFNLAEAIKSCSDFVSGGGHAAAAGVKMSTEKLEEFSKHMNDYYRSLKLKDQERFLEAKEDVEVTNLSEFSLDLMKELRQLEPFGEGNEEPVFLLPKMTILDVTKMGDRGQHLRMLVRDVRGKTLKLIAFGAEKEWLEYNPGEKAKLWIGLTENEWNGIRSVEGRILRMERAVEF